jgi:hypothetical protein
LDKINQSVNIEFIYYIQISNYIIIGIKRRVTLANCKNIQNGLCNRR